MLTGALLMDEFEKELRKDSLDEIESNLLQISDLLHLLVVEKVDDKVINEIFRLVHTVKGNTKAIDLDSLASITHHFEDLLINLRNKQIIYSTKIHEACLEFCDRMIDAIENLRIDFGYEPDFTKLDNLINLASESQMNNVQAAKKASSSLKVLVAEDDELIREIICTTLSEVPIAGIEIDYATNGLEAFKKLYANSYDFFITDLNMPKMDGESLLEMWRLKLCPHHCSSILIITGDAQAINSLSLVDDGLYTLIKPFDLEHLSKLLKLILGSIKFRRV